MNKKHWIVSIEINLEEYNKELEKIKESGILKLTTDLLLSEDSSNDIIALTILKKEAPIIFSCYNTPTSGYKKQCELIESNKTEE